MHAYLEQVLPASMCLNWWGFVPGLFESFLYGFYAAIVFEPIDCFFNRRCGA